MGHIFAFIITFLLVIVGFDHLLIALAVGGIIGLIVGIVQAVQEKKGLKSSNNSQHKSHTKKQSYWDDEEQVLNDMILIDMMEKDKKKKTKKKEFDWETHCESCGELLEDCECDWRGQSKQDISQDDMDDLEFDEMNDIWDEMDGEDDSF